MADPLILVTGGTGHLGRDLVARLLARGRRVRVFARLPGRQARGQGHCAIRAHHERARAGDFPDHWHEKLLATFAAGLRVIAR